MICDAISDNAFGISKYVYLIIPRAFGEPNSVINYSPGLKGSFVKT